MVNCLVGLQLFNLDTERKPDVNYIKLQENCKIVSLCNMHVVSILIKFHRETVGCSWFISY